MKTFLKFLSRNKLYTFIEVVGLAVALSFIVFISAFVLQELGYDNALKDTDNVYVAKSGEFYGNSATMKEQLSEAMPEVEGCCRMIATASMGGVRLTYSHDGEEFKQNALGVDADFFQFFTFPFAEGDRNTALQTRDAVVVSKSFAERCFNGKSPLGQRLQVNIDEGSTDLVVTGVYEDFRNTVFPKADFIYRIEQFELHYPNLLRNGNGTTELFFRLAPGTDVPALEEKALKVLKEQDVLFQCGLCKTFTFVPFRKIHFYSEGYSNPFEGIINLNFVYLFLAAGILLLVFAVLNYISLTVAQIGFRAKEMATRRLLGEQKGGIVFRYIKEAFLLTLFAFALALVLTSWLEPLFVRLIGKEVDLFGHINATGIGLLALLLMVLSLLTGILPALLMLRYQPIDVVKGNFADGGRMGLGRVFIGLESAVTIATLCVVFAMFLQLRHMANQDRGYERKGVISVVGAKEYADYGVDELRALPFVERIGHVQFSPAASGRSSWGFDYNGEHITIEMFIGDSTAFNLLGFRVLSRNAAPLNHSLWLTESTMRYLGVDLTCDLLSLGGNDYPVCGVIRDFRRGNLTVEETAGINLCYYVQDINEEGSQQNLRQLLVKVNGGTKEAVKALEQFYRDKQIESNISIRSVDTEIASMYKHESSNMQLIALFTLLTLMLSVMALVAMSTYYAKQQAKNVSIRKVFGFERKDVFFSMLKNFMKIVLYAALLSLPMGYVLVKLWLQDYNCRIENHWWIYATVLLVVLLVSALAISAQAIRLMNTNPVKTLQKE